MRQFGRLIYPRSETIVGSKVGGALSSKSQVDDCNYEECKNICLSLRLPN